MVCDLCIFLLFNLGNYEMLEKLRVEIRIGKIKCD